MLLIFMSPTYLRNCKVQHLPSVHHIIPEIQGVPAGMVFTVYQQTSGKSQVKIRAQYLKT